MSGEINKVVIPARGLGSRMRKQDGTSPLSAAQVAAADAGMKAMIPIKRPFLDYVLSGVADAGYTEVCLVIGPEHEAIREYYEVKSPPRRVRVFFAIQQEPRGSADAMLAAEKFAGDDEFLMINSDNYYPQGALRGLRSLGMPGVALFERGALLKGSNIDAARIRSYAICNVTADGYLDEIIEKPGEAADTAGDAALISMNMWRFSRSIFNACRNAPLSSRGEYELPGAVQQQIVANKARYKVWRSDEGVLDLSHRSDIESVTKKLSAIEPEP
jgi:glucose-1-phosphate thymidylyltransferase